MRLALKQIAPALGTLTLIGSLLGVFSPVAEAAMEFNESCYLARYPDVKTGWVDRGGKAKEHWQKHGQFEGRLPGCQISSGGASPVVIGLDPQRFAGAVASLTWNGREFINIADHGRQLQSAIQIDGYGECNNPTEAGGSRDPKDKTSSRLLGLDLSRMNVLRAQTQMAFWVYNKKTGACTLGADPRVKRATSNHILDKVIEAGVDGDPQSIRFVLDFIHPVSEVRTSVVYEFLTGYLNSEFNRFYALKNGKAQPITNFDDLSGAGFPDGSKHMATEAPVIISDASQKYAMGVYSPPSSIASCNGVSHHYNLYEFTMRGTGPMGGSTNKWSLAFEERMGSPCQRVTGGEIRRRFEVLVAVGTLADVTAKMNRLIALHP